MNILLVGAGRMGCRHIHALMKYVPHLRLTVCEQSADAIENLRQIFTDEIYQGFHFSDLDSLHKEPFHFEGAIIATSAYQRLELIERVLRMGIKNLLVEKPVEQSQKHFDQIIALLNQYGARAYVNFIKRCIHGYREINELVKNTPQFIGQKKMIISGGASGIGCNGIHFVDSAIELFEANTYKIKFAEIDEILIPSGRGENFKDFGGSIIIDFFSLSGHLSGTLHASLSSESSISYLISILGSHGRIEIDENEDKYNYTMRNHSSQLPVYRCYADYQKWQSHDLQLIENVGFVGVREWLKTFQGQNVVRLPELKNTRMSHQIVFEWLEHSNQFDWHFPIT